MPNTSEEKSLRRFKPPLLDLLFWPLFLSYVFFVIEPFLIYHNHFAFWLLPPYIPGSDVYADFPSFPGEAAMYLAARLLHLFYFPWAAALIVTATAWLLCLGAGRYIALFSQDRLRWLRFVPALIVLMQYSRFYHYQMENLSIAFGLALVLLYAHAPIQRAAFRFVLFLLLSCIMYTAATQAYLLFIALCVIYEFFARRRWYLGVAQLLSILPLCWAASAFIFDINSSDALRSVLPYEPIIYDYHGPALYYSLYIFFPTAGLLCACWDVCANKIAKRSSNASFESTGNEKPVEDELSAKSKIRRIFPIIEAMIVLIVVFGTPLISANQYEKRELRIKYYSLHHMWAEVLREASKIDLEHYSIVYCHSVDRALYHSNRLLDDMFMYPQKSGWELYKISPSPDEALRPAEYMAKTTEASETYYEIGCINDAENNIYDALMVMQYYPQGLKLAALINIVKGRPESARTFLCALREDFIYRDEAQELLDRLDADSSMSSDEEIQYARSIMLDQDQVNNSLVVDVIGLTEEDTLGELLQTLLKKNERNRMAFEYLMAHYLLTGQVEMISKNVARLRDFNYTRIPRACEEALLIHSYRMGGAMPELHGYKISQESRARFKACDDIMNKYGRDPQAAFPEFAEKYGDSYFFYRIYGISGMKQ
ncbi:hypothetical protein JXA32_14750 [Candidatus Sumerlaeota bacterium]|nr:hypothetical protein [Candidatus Sumerlaeota bacterium]